MNVNRNIIMQKQTKNIAAIIIMFISLNLPNETSAQKVFDINFGFLSGIPSAVFGKNVDNAAAGGNISFGYRLPGKPVIVGAEVMFFRYGKERRSVLLSPDIPDLPVKITNSNNMILTDLFFRIQPDWNKVMPYFEGLFGFNYLYTRTSANTRTNDGHMGATNFSDTALFWGLGGGLKFKMFEFSEKKLKKRTFVSIFFNLNARYLFGGEAEYLRKGSIIRDYGNVYYDSLKSKTDMFIFNAGFSLVFDITK